MQATELHGRLSKRRGWRRGDVVLQVRYAEKRVGSLASGFRPDQNVTAFRPRGFELVILDQQPGELAFLGGPFVSGNFGRVPFLPVRCRGWEVRPRTPGGGGTQTARAGHRAFCRPEPRPG